MAVLTRSRDIQRRTYASVLQNQTLAGGRYLGRGRYRCPLSLLWIILFTYLLTRRAGITACLSKKRLELTGIVISLSVSQSGPSGRHCISIESVHTPAVGCGTSKRGSPSVGAQNSATSGGCSSEVPLQGSPFGPLSLQRESYHEY